MENICLDCKQPFILSEKDVVFFKRNHLQLPKRCYSCREKRRDSKRINLEDCVGTYICRTKVSKYGDRTYVGESGKVKLLEVRKDGTLVVESRCKWISEENKVLPAHMNDGYWKVVEV